MFLAQNQGAMPPLQPPSNSPMYYNGFMPLSSPRSSPSDMSNSSSSPSSPEKLGLHPNQLMDPQQQAWAMNQGMQSAPPVMDGGNMMMPLIYMMGQGIYYFFSYLAASDTLV